MLGKIIGGVSAALGTFGITVGAHAAVAGGGGALPWDAPLTTIQTDLSGPTASLIALIAIVGVFGVLIFGGELNHFFRTLVYLVMLAAVLVAGNNLLTSFNITGATVEGGQPAYAALAFLAGVGVTSIIFSLGLWLRKLYRRTLNQENDQVTNEARSTR